jgi:hypothetical protein
MDAPTRQDPTTALHRAYLDALRKAAETRANDTEPSHEAIVRAHKRAAAIERLRASLVTIDIR